MRPLCRGMISHPWFVDPCLISVSSLVRLVSFIRVPFLNHYLKTYSLVLQGFCYRRLSRGKAAYDFPNPSDSGKASAWMKAVSRERFVPLDADADAEL